MDGGTQRKEAGGEGKEREKGKEGEEKERGILVLLTHFKR